MRTLPWSETGSADRGDRGERLRLRLLLAQIHEREPCLLGERLREVAFPDVAQLHQDLADAAALLALLHERFLHHALVDHAVVLEDLPEQSTRCHG